jgi:pimeloyl-ACP methyl ester carboxylesterase
MKNLICLGLAMLFLCSARSQSVFEEIEYPFPVQKFQLSNGERLAYMDEGEGEVLLFIHGLGSYAPAWKKNIHVLKDNYRCIAIDLIGYGKSSKPNDMVLLKDQSAVIHELLTHLEIEMYHIVGHSMGGQIGIHHALDYPAHVKSLILAAPAGIETFTDQQKSFFEMVTPQAIAATSDEDIAGNLKKNFFSFPADAQFMIDDRVQMKQDPEFSLYCQMIVNGIKGMVRQTVTDQLGNLNSPVLILFGGSDELIPNRLLNPQLTVALLAEYAQELLPKASIRVLPEAGHMVMFERYEDVNRFILDFVK